MSGVKGRSGRNPNERLWRDIIIRVEQQRSLSAKVSLIEQAAGVLWDCAIAGDVTALKEIGDRLDGRPITPIEHSGELIHQFPVDRPPLETREVWIGRRSKELGQGSGVLLGRTAGTAD